MFSFKIQHLFRWSSSMCKTMRFNCEFETKSNKHSVLAWVISEIVSWSKLSYHRSCGEGKENMVGPCMAPMASAQTQHMLLLLVLHWLEQVMHLHSEFSMLPPEGRCWKSHGQAACMERDYAYAVYTPVSISRYISQLLRWFLTRFWALKSGESPFHFLLATFPQLANPALHFRVLILANDASWASMILFRFAQGETLAEEWRMSGGEKPKYFSPSLSCILLLVASSGMAVPLLELQQVNL